MFVHLVLQVFWNHMMFAATGHHEKTEKDKKKDVNVRLFFLIAAVVSAGYKKKMGEGEGHFLLSGRGYL
jgi:hypothetical protein